MNGHGRQHHGEKQSKHKSKSRVVNKGRPGMSNGKGEGGVVLMRAGNNNLSYAEVQAEQEKMLPDIGVPLHVEVVKVVGALGSAKVRSLQPLDDLGFHYHGYVRWQ